MRGGLQLIVDSWISENGMSSRDLQPIESAIAGGIDAVFHLTNI